MHIYLSIKADFPAHMTCLVKPCCSVCSKGSIFPETYDSAMEEL